MNNEELKRDFEAARIRHVHFKSRLRSFLFGNGGDETDLRDPVACSLGQWIAARAQGTGAYAHLPEARALHHKHVLIHREASRLLDLYHAGQGEQAVAGFSQVQQIANEMVALLITMEEKMRTGA